MANNKSAEKRILVAERNRLRNRTALSTLRTSIRKFRQAVATGDAATATALLSQAHATIDKSAQKGVIHSRTASRYKSRLAQAAGRLGAAAR